MPPEPPQVVNLFTVDSEEQSSTSPVLISPFDKGQYSIDFTAAFTQPAYGDRHRFVTGDIGISYGVFDHFTVSLEMDGDYLEAPNSRGGGGGFNVRGRLELFRLHDASLFVDASAGLIESDHPIPTSGTHFNFTEMAGVGVLVPVTSRVFIEGGARFQHISNAGISVNPGYEGVQGYLGLMVRF